MRRDVFDPREPSAGLAWHGVKGDVNPSSLDGPLKSPRVLEPERLPQIWPLQGRDEESFLGQAVLRHERFQKLAVSHGGSRDLINSYPRGVDNSHINPKYSTP